METLAGARKNNVWPAAEKEHRRVDVVNGSVVYHARVLYVERHSVLSVELDHHRVAVHTAPYELPCIAHGRVESLNVAGRQDNLFLFRDLHHLFALFG